MSTLPTRGSRPRVRLPEHLSHESFRPVRDGAIYEVWHLQRYDCWLLTVSDAKPQIMYTAGPIDWRRMWALGGHDIRELMCRDTCHVPRGWVRGHVRHGAGRALSVLSSWGAQRSDQRPAGGDGHNIKTVIFTFLNWRVLQLWHQSM